MRRLKAIPEDKKKPLSSMNFFKAFQRRPKILRALLSHLNLIERIRFNGWRYYRSLLKYNKKLYLNHVKKAIIMSVASAIVIGIPDEEQNEEGEAFRPPLPVQINYLFLPNANQPRIALRS
jgi:hypothetical protein